jgi:Protein of unknown function (DUF2628)
MPVFTVHAPQSYGTDLRATDKFTFVRDGFHLWAMIFGPFWLIWNRLWIATLGWIVVIAVLDIGLARLGAGRSAIWFADILVAILLGLEAASLQRWTFSRGNWRQLDIIVADDEDSAERRFFDRWTAGRRGASYDPLSVDRGGPPPTRDIPGQPFSKPPPLPEGSIIGLFPEPGGQR